MTDWRVRRRACCRGRPSMKGMVAVASLLESRAGSMIMFRIGVELLMERLVVKDMCCSIMMVHREATDAHIDVRLPDLSPYGLATAMLAIR